ncbi:hypothetical protein SALBM311S_02307 [Streptomyces alboniger]
MSHSAVIECVARRLQPHRGARRERWWVLRGAPSSGACGRWPSSTTASTGTSRWRRPGRHPRPPTVVMQRQRYGRIVFTSSASGRDRSGSAGLARPATASSSRPEDRSGRPHQLPRPRKARKHGMLGNGRATATAGTRLAQEISGSSGDDSRWSDARPPGLRAGTSWRTPSRGPIRRHAQARSRHSPSEHEHGHARGSSATGGRFASVDPAVTHGVVPVRSERPGHRGGDRIVSSAPVASRHSSRRKER